MKKYVFAMQRSGHTAIVNWLCKQNAPAYHYDHMITLKKKKKKQEEYRPKRFIFEYIPSKRGKVKIRTQSWNYDPPEHLFRKSLVIYSYEDQEIFLPSRKVIAIIRSPLNWKASRYRLLQKHKMVYKLKGENDIWLSHLESDVYKIFFDEWFVNKEYRKKICADLKLKFTDNGLLDVQQVSSFDQKKFDGRAQDMNVLNRWKAYKNDRIFTDQISEEMFEKYHEALSDARESLKK
jgi:hypothetical protein